MSSLVIFFIATIAVIGPLYKVESAPSQALDINTILKFIQQQRLNSGTSKQRRLQLRQDSSDSDTDSDSDSDECLTESDETDYSDSNRNARIRKERIIELIKTVANEKNNRLRNNDRITYRKGKPKSGQNTYISRSEKYDNSQGYNNVQTDILEKLFSKGLNDEERKEKSFQNKGIKTNYLLPLSTNKVKNYNKNDNVIGLEDYSKVYVVLNPQTVRKSKNKNSLNDLISKVLLLSSSTSKKDRQVKRKPRRYKGFSVSEDHLQRRSRKSKEIYAPRDSSGDEYVQKKTRNGGNPSGGHTAIPYVRNRGDIYERNN